MKLKEYLKEISIKKLFITILCSIIITTSLSFSIAFIESLPGTLVNEAWSTWNDKMPEELIEYGKNVEETINKKIQEEKNMYGKKVLGIERSTFIIDENGIWLKEFRKVKVKNHVTQVIEWL